MNIVILQYDWRSAAVQILYNVSPPPGKMVPGHAQVDSNINETNLSR